MADPIVTVKQGPLKGIIDTDLDGQPFYKFKGIPFAKPPIGPLRFKAPQPLEPWTGVKDATKEGSACLSRDFMTLNPMGTEDCLYLNVFTKELPKPGQSLKPVMVSIHGGAFTGGSSGEMMQGPKNLLTQDVVLVTINYRLGIFGFLSLDDTSLDVPGNAGLKDQTFALKWVQENIAAFNGDPNNVTIFGISAGGASVHFQILSPSAKGLFHKAIAQSGSVLNPWAWGQQNAEVVAENLGHAVNNEKEALEVLQKADAMDLFQASAKMPDILLNSQTRRPFGPVIEKPNPTAFLTENPSELLASGRFNQVPTIMGVVNNEGLIYDFMEKIGSESDVDALECGLMWNLGMEEGSKQREKVKQSVQEFYFKDGFTIESLYQIIGDSAFNIGTIEAVKLALKNSTSPLYIYIFSYDIPLGHAIAKFLKFETNRKGKGICHGGEMAFLFSSAMTADPGFQLTTEDRQGIDEVVKIWTDFAKTGKPHAKWEPVEPGNMKYFNIDKELKLVPGLPFAERTAFWDKVISEVSGFDAGHNLKAK